MILSLRIGEIQDKYYRTKFKQKIVNYNLFEARYLLLELKIRNN